MSLCDLPIILCWSRSGGCHNMTSTCHGRSPHRRGDSDVVYWAAGHRKRPRWWSVRPGQNAAYVHPHCDTHPGNTTQKGALNTDGALCTMTSSNGNIFRVTGLLCGEFTGHRWIPRQWRGALMFYLISAWINSWVNNREAGDLRCHRAHYDVSVM